MRSTADKKLVIKDMVSGMHPELVAKKHKVAKSTIHKWCRESGVGTHHYTDAQAAEKEKRKAYVLSLAGTMLDKDVYEITGVQPKTIGEWRRAAGIPPFDTTRQKIVRTEFTPNEKRQNLMDTWRLPDGYQELMREIRDE